MVIGEKDVFPVFQVAQCCNEEPLASKRNTGFILKEPIYYGKVETLEF